MHCERELSFAGPTFLLSIPFECWLTQVMFALLPFFLHACGTMLFCCHGFALFFMFYFWCCHGLYFVVQHLTAIHIPSVIGRHYLQLLEFTAAIINNQSFTFAYNHISCHLCLQLPVAFNNTHISQLPTIAYNHISCHLCLQFLVAFNITHNSQLPIVAYNYQSFTFAYNHISCHLCLRFLVAFNITHSDLLPIVAYKLSEFQFAYMDISYHLYSHISSCH